MSADSGLLFESPYRFRKRADELPADMRPIWRIAALCLILGNSRGRKASIRKIQILNWAIRTQEAQLSLVNFLNGKATPESVVVRFDPAFPAALDLIIAEDLAKMAGSGAIELSHKGIAFFDAVTTDTGCMGQEKEFLKTIRPLALENHI